MLSHLQEQPADKILGLMKLYGEDPRPQKIDLGVGVYKDAEGKTPIFRAIKEAEKRLWGAEETKSYVGLIGDPAYRDAMARLILGDAVGPECIAGAATPGGTGAVRNCFELARMANPDVRVWVSDPTWPNHLSILKFMGLPTLSYRYFDSESRAVDFDGMIADLSEAKAGDLVLLHGCCHNPTGANLNLAQWQQVIDVLLKTGATPMVDIAYQGFGDGLEEDAAGIRLVAKSVPELLVAASCSKNFGIYRERAGLAMAISQDAARRGIHEGALAHLNRQNFSFPPDHGTRLVTMVLTDDALRADWMAELEEIRLGMLGLREQLASELQKASGSDRFGFIADHRGMFSRLGTTPELVERLRVDHAIYMVGDSRMNIAGLNKQTVPVLAQAIVDAGI